MLDTQNDAPIAEARPSFRRILREFIHEAFYLDDTPLLLPDETDLLPDGSRKNKNFPDYYLKLIQ